MPQIILSWEYMPISWSARISNRRHVASSEPVANACPLGKYWKFKKINSYLITKTSKNKSWTNCTAFTFNQKLNILFACKLTVIALISDSWPEKVCLHIPSLTSHNWNKNILKVIFHFCFILTNFIGFFLKCKC